MSLGLFLWTAQSAMCCQGCPSATAQLLEAAGGLGEKAGYAPEVGALKEPSRLPRCLGFDQAGVDIMKDHLSAGVNPSGALWHPRLERLLIVDDGDSTGQGAIYSMRSDGTDARAWRVPGDLEGLTYVDPESDVVYVGVEEPAGIIEFDLAENRVLREFDLSPWIGAGRINRGLEALAFVPDSTHPEGGRFYAGHQGSGKVLAFSLPLRSDPLSLNVTYVGHLTPRWLLPGVLGTPDVSGLDYHRESGILFAIFDLANRIVALRADPSDPLEWRRIGEWELPGSHQEGFAIRSDTCDMFIAGDRGEILRVPARVKP